MFRLNFSHRKITEQPQFATQKSLIKGSGKYLNKSASHLTVGGCKTRISGIDYLIMFLFLGKFLQLGEFLKKKVNHFFK
jgi:hypothetical protein